MERFKPPPPGCSAWRLEIYVLPESTEKNKVLIAVEKLLGRIKGMRTVSTVEVLDPVGQFVLRTRLYWFWAALPFLLTIFGLVFLLLPFSGVNKEKPETPMKVELVNPASK
jgi:hypothetical protein